MNYAEASITIRVWTQISILICTKLDTVYILLKAVIRIRRIRKFFGLPDPDPSDRGTNPDLDPSIIKQKVRKTLISTVL